MKKVIRVAAVPVSLDILLRGQLRFLNKKYEVVGVASADKEIHERIRQREGIRTVPIRIERQISLIRDLFSLFNLLRFFRKERPDIVHSITPKAGLLSMTAARLAGVPIRIHTFTGLIFPWRTGMMARLLRTMDQITCSMATHIIPEGKGVKKDLLMYKVTKKPLYVLANGNINGVDTTYFTPREKSIDNGTTRFVFVGRIVADKGIEELKSAFERLQNAELIFIGSFEQHANPLSEACYEWVQKGERVQYVGFQEDIRPYLTQADVLVLPSHREGFPNTPLQAGAMGLPCIVTDICGCNEIVINEITGLLVPPRDSDALFTAMKRLIDDSKLRKTMGINARRHIVAKFDQQMIWDAQIKFYDDVSEVC